MCIKNGKLHIGWAYTRSMKQPKTSVVRGVDTGITDVFHTSDGKAIGFMKPVLDFYHNTVEPSFAGLSDLRNKKRSVSHYLRHHKDLPEDVRRSLIQKMDRLDYMMQTMDACLNCTDICPYKSGEIHNSPSILERQIIHFI